MGGIIFLGYVIISTCAYMLCPDLCQICMQKLALLKAQPMICSRRQFCCFFKINKKDMIFHENRLLADDSHEISYLFLWVVTKFVVCCSRDWRFKG